MTAFAATPPQPEADPPVSPNPQAASSCVLETRDLSKVFGGLIAVGGVSLRILDRETHAIIGPNGAGKSTLVNLLTGHLAPSGGEIFLRGRPIAGLPAHRMTRLGLGRSYQKTNIFPTFTVFENCRLAAQARQRHAFRFFRPALADRATVDHARAALVRCGLEDRADRTAGALSYGEQRQLEIAMVLASGPDVLVLDEPLAGMGKEESDRMVALLQALGRDHTLVLIEHDMDAVFSLAQTLSVMVNGKLLESGPLEQVRASDAVREAYLGDGEEVF